MEWKSNQKDFYSKGVVLYAERWAEIMENQLKLGIPVKESQNEASNKADVDGITGYMHSFALQALIKWWKFGNQLNN